MVITVGELREFTFTEPKLTELGVTETVAIAGDATTIPIMRRIKTIEHTRSILRISLNFL